MTDIEITKQFKMKNIEELLSDLNINNYDLYGKYKAKINDVKANKKGKIILVTAINPTPYGEGKTTVAIGIHDSLCKLGKSSIAVLREPSMGPVFGIKGGATGGADQRRCWCCTWYQQLDGAHLSVHGGRRF